MSIEQEEMRETLGWAGGRKYVLVLLGFFVATVCLFIKVNGKPIAEFTGWTMFVLADFGFYFGVNYAQKKADSVRIVEEKKIEAIKEAS